MEGVARSVFRQYRGRTYPHHHCVLFAKTICRRVPLRILAIAIALTLYFTRSKKIEKKRAEELEKYASKNEYELAVLKKEADEDGKVLIKKEYIDENGDKHIVIGHDEKRNKSIVDKDDLI